MATNTGAWLDGKDKPLRVAEAEMPKPEADEVVIRNYAMAVNPVDWKIQDSGMFIQKWPMILGCDVAGEITEVGSDVKNFGKGDRVFAHVVSLITNRPETGGFQYYSAAKAGKTAKIPNSSISYNDASVLPLAFDTAAVGLYLPAEGAQGLGLPFPSLSPKPSNKTVVIWGGSSSVGALAIQLAVASGVKVVTTASSHNHSFCKDLGATEVIDYKSSSVVDDVISAVKSIGGEFAGLYDAISIQDQSFIHAVPIIDKLGGGIIAVTLHAEPENAPSSVKTAQVMGINDMTHQLWGEFMTPALEKGVIKCVPPPYVVGKGLESVQKGLDANKKGVSAKKVIIELD